MWPTLEITSKTITVARNFVSITMGTSLLFVAIQRLHFESAGNVLLSELGLVESMSCTAVHLQSCSMNIVLLSDMIEGSYRSWDLYTTGQLVDGLQQKKKTGFH